MAQFLTFCQKRAKIKKTAHTEEKMKKKYERPVLKILVLEDSIVTSTDPYEFDVDWGYNIFE